MRMNNQSMKEKQLMFQKAIKEQRQGEEYFKQEVLRLLNEINDKLSHKENSNGL